MNKARWWATRLLTIVTSILLHVSGWSSAGEGSSGDEDERSLESEHVWFEDWSWMNELVWLWRF